MSTLRISNIEAKADSSSPTVDEQLRFTNSDGDLMLYLDGRTAGITTVGINTTNQTIKFDANNNVMVTGIITATEFHGSLAVGTSVTYGDNEKAYFGNGLDLELFHNGTNSVINNTEGALLFQNNGSSSMYIGSTGKVGIGTNNPTASLVVRSSDNTLGILTSTDDGANLDLFDNDTQSRIRTVDGQLQFRADVGNDVADSSIRFFIDGTNEKLRITSSGQLLVGTSSARSIFKMGATGNGQTPTFQFETANDDSNNSLSLTYGRNNSYGAEIFLAKHRTATVGGTTIVQSADRLGGITFSGSDGTNFQPAAFIEGEVDGTPGTNDMPGRLVFATTADGANVPTERLRIDSSGNVMMGTISATAEFTVKGGGTVASFEGTGGSGSIAVRDADAGTFVFLKDDGGTFHIQTSGSSYSDKFSITPDGNVGLNMTSPRSRLDVFETTTGDQTAIRIGNSNTPSSANDRRLEFVDGTGTSEGTNKYTYGYVQGYRQGGSNDGGLIFGTKNDNASAPSEKLRIDSSGRVMIGNTAAGQMFGGADDLIVGTTSGARGITIISENNTVGRLLFSDSLTSGAATYQGQVNYNHSNDTLDLRTYTGGSITLSTSNTERVTINSTGAISFDQGTTAAITPSQTTASSIGHQTMSGGSSWFNHGIGTDYFGVDGDWKLTNGTTYGKIVARNASGSISNATEAGHTWFMVCKTVAGTLGNSNWVVEPVAGWKMAWPTSLAAGATATFYMRDAVESFGSPTIPASGDYYIGWFYSVSQDMGTNGGDYYVDATSGGKIYYYSSEGDLSNPHQRIPRQGDSWDATMTGEKIHFRFETLPKADLTGTVFASPLLVDPVMQGVPLIDGLPMAGGQLVKDVQWATNVSSVEFQNADFVNCNYLVTYSINGSDGSGDSTGWFQTRLQFCDHDGSFYTNTNDYISHCEWCSSTSTSATINSSYSGYQRSIWLTGNGSGFDHEGYVWIIPSNFRHNRNSTISQRWSQGTESVANTHPHIFVRGHSFLSTGVEGSHYREEGGGTYRGTNGVFNISGFRLYGSNNSDYHTPASNGSSNGYVRIWRFKSGFEAREVS